MPRTSNTRTKKPVGPEALNLQVLQLDQIIPNSQNPRGIDIPTEDTKLTRLMDSIDEFGVMVPIVVTPHGNRYLLVDGERRFHASKKVGRNTIPAYVIREGDGDLTNRDVLFRMFQIHHLHEQWGPLQQCRALEVVYKDIKRRGTIKDAPDDETRFVRTVAELVERTGIHPRTASDRVKFLRWPETIKAALYGEAGTDGDDADDNRRGAYSYILEIEDKIVMPAITNYSEYFTSVSADDVRSDLFNKLNESLTTAQDVRKVAAYFNAQLPRASDRKRVTNMLTKLRKNVGMSYEDARQELQHALPNVRVEPPVTLRRLLSTIKRTTAAISGFESIELSVKSSRATRAKDELIAASAELQQVLSQLIDAAKAEDQD